MTLSPDVAIVPLSLPPLPARPLVSVLIASYNYADFLGEALDSLLAQSYGHFEGIVCDDGSTDDSLQIAAAYARRDERIRLIAKENGGVASALNRAFAAARGDVIALLDADDLFAPEKLAQVVACLQHAAGVGLVLHAMHVIDRAGNPMGEMPFGGACEDGWLAERVGARGGRWRAMPASALAFHRALAERLFPIPEASFRSEADGFLSMLAPLLSKVAFLPDALACYRLHGANLTGTRRIDRAVLRRGLDALNRKNAAVNARIDALGVPAPSLSLEDNANYHEQRFMAALLDGVSRRDLWRRYRRLMRMLLSDDLYRPLRKVGGLFVYGSAILLPAARRTAWLNATLSAQGLRRILHRLLGALKGRNRKSV